MLYGLPMPPTWQDCRRVTERGRWHVVSSMLWFAAGRTFWTTPMTFWNLRHTEQFIEPNQFVNFDVSTETYLVLYVPGIPLLCLGFCHKDKKQATAFPVIYFSFIKLQQFGIKVIYIPRLSGINVLQLSFLVFANTRRNLYAPGRHRWQALHC